MLDRITNLLVLMIAAVVAITAVVSIVGAWNATNPWEEEWRLMPGKSLPGSTSELVLAMKSATKAQAFSDVDTLRQYLESNYERTGNVLVRLSPDELLQISLKTCAALLLLLVPICINYIRHSRFHLWNSQQVSGMR